MGDSTRKKNDPQSVDAISEVSLKDGVTLVRLVCTVLILLPAGKDGFCVQFDVSPSEYILHPSTSMVKQQEFNEYPMKSARQILSLRALFRFLLCQHMPLLFGRSE